MPAPHPWALPSTPAWVWLQDGTLLRQHSTAHASTVVGAFTSTLDHCTHHRTPAASRMGARWAASRGQVRPSTPRRVAPRAAALRAASSPRCAPPQLPPLGILTAHARYLGLRLSEENELCGALCAPPDGSAPRMGWWGELGVALHASGRLGRRVAPRRCVALRPARALSCRRRRREGWGGDRVGVGARAWEGGGRRGDAASSPPRTSPANGAAPGGAQRRQQPALRAPSAPLHWAFSPLVRACWSQEERG